MNQTQVTVTRWYFQNHNIKPKPGPALIELFIAAAQLARVVLAQYGPFMTSAEHARIQAFRNLGEATAGLLHLPPAPLEDDIPAALARLATALYVLAWAFGTDLAKEQQAWLKRQEWEK